VKRANKPLDTLIFSLRGHKVMLDADLADLYGVPTKRFNEQVKRNLDRFPVNFMFQLTRKEWAYLRSQFATTTSYVVDAEDIPDMRSQFATASPQVLDKKQSTNLRSQKTTAFQRNVGSPPYAFTEHGAIMAATILNSDQAVRMSIYVVRAFMQMREQLAANAAILKRLAEIDKTLPALSLSKEPALS